MRIRVRDGATRVVNWWRVPRGTNTTWPRPYLQLVGAARERIATVEDVEHLIAFSMHMWRRATARRAELLEQLKGATGEVARGEHRPTGAAERGPPRLVEGAGSSHGGSPLGDMTAAS